MQIKEREFKVGDIIKFDYDDGIRVKKESGKIVQIGKHGYWVDDAKGCYGTASIRCPFNLARKP